jgi:hypothetical protein
MEESYDIASAKNIIMGLLYPSLLIFLLHSHFNITSFSFIWYILKLLAEFSLVRVGNPPFDDEF